MRISSIIGAAIASAVCFSAAGSAVARPRWPTNSTDYAVTYQINTAHTGHIQMSEAFSTPLKQAWSVGLGSSLSYPVVAEGLVIAIADGSEINTLDLSTGKQKWAKLVSRGSLLGPAYDNGNLFVLDSSGTLPSYVATTGKYNWSGQLPGQYAFSSDPMAVNGTVYTGGAGEGGTLYAVDESTGKLDWDSQVQNGDDSSPAYGDNGIYVSYPCQYYKFSPTTGKQIWNYNGGCEGGGGNTPSYFAGRVFIEDWTGGDYVLSATSGHLMGTFATDNDSTPAFYQNPRQANIGVTLSQGTLYCFNIATADILWKFNGAGLTASPIIVNGLVVVGTTGGELYVLDGENGKVRWSANIGSAVTSLSAGQGTLFAVGNGTLTAFVPK